MKNEFENLIDSSNLSGNKTNHFFIQKCKTPKSRMHRRRMRQVCEWLKDNNYNFKNEAIFKGRKGRGDIVTDFLPFRMEGKIGSVIEIVNTEKEASIIKKKTYYPSELNLIVVTASGKFDERTLK